MRVTRRTTAIAVVVLSAFIWTGLTTAAVVTTPKQPAQSADIDTGEPATWQQLSAEELASIFRDWNNGRLQSYLIEITSHVLAKRDDGRPLVDAIEDEAEQKGTGRWTSQSALELGVPLTGITEAVFARMLSSQKARRVNASGVLAGPAVSGKAPSGLVDDVQEALYASKIVAYAQGFEHLAAGSNASSAGRQSHARPESLREGRRCRRGARLRLRQVRPM